MPFTLVTANVTGVLEPHVTFVVAGSVKDTAGAVSVMVIFLISIVCTPLSVGMFAIVR